MPTSKWSSARARVARDAPERKASATTGHAMVLVLVLLAAVCLALSIAGPTWSAQVQRGRQLEWMRVGLLYRAALQEFHDRSPGATKTYPNDLTELLRDPRYVSVQRYMRQLYLDPITQQPWQPVRNSSGQVVGVHSTSKLVRTTGPGQSTFSDVAFLVDAPPPATP